MTQKVKEGKKWREQKWERESRRGKRDRKRRGDVENKKCEVSIVDVVMMDIAELSRNKKSYIERDYHLINECFRKYIHLSLFKINPMLRAINETVFIKRNVPYI